jgi:hypothetical protein
MPITSQERAVSFVLRSFDPLVASCTAGAVRAADPRGRCRMRALADEVRVLRRVVARVVDAADLVERLQLRLRLSQTLSS